MHPRRVQPIADDLVVWVSAALRTRSDQRRRLMTPLLMAVVLAVGVQDKAAAPNIDGKWLIVYAEEGGKRNTTWEQRVAAAEKDTLSYSKDGDDRSVKLTFGAKQTLTAS